MEEVRGQHGRENVSLNKTQTKKVYKMTPEPSRA